MSHPTIPISVIPQRDAHGRVLGVLVNFGDDYEQQLQPNEMFRLNQQLARALAALPVEVLQELPIPSIIPGAGGDRTPSALSPFAAAPAPFVAVAPMNLDPPPAPMNQELSELIEMVPEVVANVVHQYESVRETVREKSEARSVWRTTFLDSLAGGCTPQHASERADEALALYRDRWASDVSDVAQGGGEGVH